MLYLKLYVVTLFLNLLIVLIFDNLYDPKYGLTVKDAIKLLVVFLLGPIGTILILICIWDDLKFGIKNILNAHLIKPVNKKTVKVVSGPDKTQTSSP